MDGDPDKQRSLRAVAEQLALGEIRAHFAEPLHLDNLAKVREEYERKLFAAETQLEAGQQAQLDEMQNAVTLLELAKGEMRSVQRRLAGIRTKCSACTAAVGTDVLARAVNVCNARANLSEVLQQLEIYDAVPKRVDELTMLLAPPADRRNLKAVFGEWLQLNAWRARILLQVSEALTAAGQQELEQSKRVANWEDEELMDGELQQQQQQQRRQLENRGGGSGNGAVGSSEAYSQILSVLGVHFRKVEELGEVIFGLVDSRLSAFFDLAQYEDAGALVVAVEVVERMDRSDDKERARRVKGGEHPEKAEMLLPPHKRRTAALHTLEAAMDARLDEMLPATLEPDLPPARTPSSSDDDDSDDDEEEERAAAAAAAPSKIPAFLQALSACIVDLQVVLDDVVKCFPGEYNVLGLYRWVLERRMLKLMRPAWSGTWASAGDKLQLIGWLDQYVHIVESIDGDAKAGDARELSAKTASDQQEETDSGAAEAGRTKTRAQLGSSSHAEKLASEHQLSALSRLREIKRESEVMMSAYIASAVPRMEGYVSAILARGNVPERSLDGCLQTSIPEDLFHALTQELSVVGQHGVYGQHMAVFVQRGLLRVLEGYQRAQISKAEDAAQKLPIEWCVALMNDFERMYDLCDNALAGELRQSVAGGGSALFPPDPEATAAVQEALDDVAAGFLKGVEAGTRRIVGDVFADLRDQGVIGSLFQQDWLMGASHAALTMCATFEDYFDDPDAGLRAWFASELLFGRTVALTLSRTVQAYVIALLAKLTPFADHRAAAARIRGDAASFLACFEKYLDSLRFGKLRSRAALEERLAVLGHIADTLSDAAPQKHFEQVAADFGPFAEQAIARLLFLRADLSYEQQADLLLYDVSDHANTTSGAPRFDLSDLPPLPKRATDADDADFANNNQPVDKDKKRKSARAKKKIKAAMAAIKLQNKKHNNKLKPNSNIDETIQLDMETFLK